MRAVAVTAFRLPTRDERQRGPKTVDLGQVYTEDAVESRLHVE